MKRRIAFALIGLLALVSSCAGAQQVVDFIPKLGEPLALVRDKFIALAQPVITLCSQPELPPEYSAACAEALPALLELKDALNVVISTYTAGNDALKGDQP
ncbi:MAG: hypothetical protein RL701_5990 [Pseudomonadota bacterium]|jgi:hypothetical protein